MKLLVKADWVFLVVEAVQQFDRAMQEDSTRPFYLGHIGQMTNELFQFTASAPVM